MNEAPTGGEKTPFDVTQDFVMESDRLKSSVMYI